MLTLVREVENELFEHILPFWEKLVDYEYGGIYGKVDFDLRVDQQADKGGIVTSRFLWTFSSAYRVTRNEKYLQIANHLYQFLVENIYDDEYDGLYWLVNYKGEPKDTRKHVYTQSFGIYALSEYYRAKNDENALKLAKNLYFLIENKGFDPKNNAYKEEFDREWNEMPNEMLSENGVLADITMNTHIHVLEAYTNLYKVWSNEQLKERIENLLHILYHNIYDQNSKFLGVFFDKNWNSLIDMKSFGHDIEASWLIDEALKTIGLEKEEYVQMVIDIAYNIAHTAIQADGSLINEQVDDKIDTSRVWWVQAEAMVGFLNAYERTKDVKFLELVKNLWEYTKKYIIDHRDNGEWYWSVDENGIPSKKNICDPWKASYHNGRFCLEVIERMKGK
ncbi:mannobiose 2-epimerase [Anoxybacillus tepidamans]|uniref:Cellobiose 2-epimerase n=1 Tax=Anoxybacteroides tepidamans TaxID=265948 RepID=A0A7W8IS25_9BACL|nr:AGE family epimerase/isomerase [Anoxybacillus tepidamans]MBB5325715.1 mannobiose 2-epimerase [Anoxybacillus tepidamans]